MSTNEKNPGKVHLLGCGDLGTAVGLALLETGAEPLGLRRNPDRLPVALPSMAVNFAERESMRQLGDLPCDVTLLTPTPPARDVEGYRRGYLMPVENLLSAWEGGPPRRLIYVSSTRVYGDHDGDWVDETSELRPADGQADILVEAERQLLDSPHDVTIVRFSGIYGKSPSRLLERIRGGQIASAEPLHYTNRIHREDCVGFLLHLLRGDSPFAEPIYLASDDEPAPMHEVETWLAKEMGVENVEATLTPPATNRRCRNGRLRASGYVLKYPDYRAGYRAMMTSTSMSAPLGSAAT